MLLYVWFIYYCVCECRTCIYTFKDVEGNVMVCKRYIYKDVIAINNNTKEVVGRITDIDPKTYYDITLNQFYDELDQLDQCYKIMVENIYNSYKKKGLNQLEIMVDDGIKRSKDMKPSILKHKHVIKSSSMADVDNLTSSKTVTFGDVQEFSLSSSDDSFFQSSFTYKPKKKSRKVPLVSEDQAKKTVAEKPLVSTTSKFPTTQKSISLSLKKIPPSQKPSLTQQPTFRHPSPLDPQIITQKSIPPFTPLSHQISSRSTEEIIKHNRKERERFFSDLFLAPQHSKEQPTHITVVSPRTTEIKKRSPTIIIQASRGFIPPKTQPARVIVSPPIVACTVSYKNLNNQRRSVVYI